MCCGNVDNSLALSTFFATQKGFQGFSKSNFSVDKLWKSAHISVDISKNSVEISLNFGDNYQISLIYPNLL